MHYEQPFTKDAGRFNIEIWLIVLTVEDRCIPLVYLQFKFSD